VTCVPAAMSLNQALGRDSAGPRAGERFVPGPRPRPVTAAAIAALVIAAANVGIVVSGVYPQVRPFSQLLIGVAIPLILAAGLRQGRRWAVVGMQVLLCLISLTAVLALVGARSRRWPFWRPRLPSAVRPWS
jgi:hypothetical protein